MSFKEKFIEGNNFVLSPNGKIGRIRYAIYALLFDIGYRVSFRLGVLAILVSRWFSLLYIVGLLFIVLKFFNYTKRATAIFDNKKYGYVFAGGYIAIGTYIMNYLTMKYFLAENSAGVSDWYVPEYYETSFAQVTFFIAFVAAILMFFILLFCPAKKVVEPSDNTDVVQAQQ